MSILAGDDENHPHAVAQRFYDAVNHVMSGDAAPMLELWSEQDDVTYFDPRGEIHRGRDALVSYWERAASTNRETPGAIGVTAKHVAIHADDLLLSTVTVEHIMINGEGQASRQQARATNVYRREARDWRMVHRYSEPTRASIKY